MGRVHLTAGGRAWQGTSGVVPLPENSAELDVAALLGLGGLDSPSSPDPRRSGLSVSAPAPGPPREGPTCGHLALLQETGALGPGPALVIPRGLLSLGRAVAMAAHLPEA